MGLALRKENESNLMLVEGPSLTLLPVRENQQKRKAKIRPFDLRSTKDEHLSPRHISLWDLAADDSGAFLFLWYFYRRQRAHLKP